ncbi:MAG: hypothetical protein R3B91_13750 [Planctomycetaceae bacterium]
MHHTFALRTLLKVSISCLLALSGGIFAFAEGGPIAAATIPIALGALLWNDIKGTFSLNVWMANGLGLIAFAIAGAEFSVSRSKEGCLVLATCCSTCPGFSCGKRRERLRSGGCVL